MPSGDRSRTWFPEMIEQLRLSWRSDFSMDDLIALAHKLDGMLQDIRTERGIRPPVILCRACGKRAPAAASRVSVRAVILAAERFGIVPQGDGGQIERLWNRIAERRDSISMGDLSLWVERVERRMPQNPKAAPVTRRVPVSRSARSAPGATSRPAPTPARNRPKNPRQRPSVGVRTR